jgi:hypothetical protein
MSRKTMLTAAVSLALLAAAGCTQNNQPTSNPNGMSQNPSGSGQYGTTPSPNNPNGKAPGGGAN